MSEKLSWVGGPSLDVDEMITSVNGLTFEDCKVRAGLFDFLLKIGAVSWKAYLKHEYIWDDNYYETT